MKYLFLIYGDEAVYANITEAAMHEVLSEYMAYSADLKQRGVYIAGEALQPVSTAKSVRVRNGKSVHTDGPFAETKEQLGGFYLVDVKDEAEAIALAAKIPDARTGSIEIRPIMDY
jgi:hypothetical protein